MNYQYKSGNIYLYDLFDLSSTLSCGQCFRWELIDEDTWYGIAFGKQLKVKKTNDAIIFENTETDDFLNIWVPYFDLNTDYDSIYNELCENELTKEIVKACAPNASDSLHILRQEPWEALCSFIFSQNNNIPRIKKIVNSLCMSFGDKIAPDAYSFPDHLKTASLSLNDLDVIRSGFRAKYILDAAKKLCDNEVSLESIKASDMVSARTSLMKINGVGPKVAECALLYGFHRLEAFPMDVWMIRAMNKLFPGKTPEDFGKFAGIAQQYIYHYSRLNPQIFCEE